MPKTIFTDANRVVVGVIKEERLEVGLKHAELGELLRG